MSFSIIIVNVDFFIVDWYWFFSFCFMRLDVFLLIKTVPKYICNWYWRILAVGLKGVFQISVRYQLGFVRKWTENWYSLG